MKTSKLKTFLSLVEFPAYESAELELKKIGLLRSLLGVIVFVRMAQIFDAYWIYNGGVIPPGVETHMWWLFSAIALFTVGLFTQIATVCVAVGVPLADHFFDTRNLGTDILSGVLFTFFLVNSGQFYSVDARILRSQSVLARALSPLLRFVGASNLWDIKCAYFFGFLFYALLSFVALTFHVEDQYWTTGLTTKTLLLSSYISKFYWVFRAIDETNPAILGLMSIVVGIGQTIFQFFMLPLLFTKFGRHFVAVWGMGFILISLLNINLSYLPHVELVLWVMIFCPVRSEHKRLEVFYDDSCRLCTRTMRVLRLLNYNARIIFSPLSRSLDALRNAGVSEEQARQSMYGLARGKVVDGYDLYVTIAKGNALLWGLVPLLLLGYVGRIGPRVYQLVARRRSHESRPCPLQSPSTVNLSVTEEGASCGALGRYIKSLLYITFVGYTIVFLLLSLPPWKRSANLFLGPQRFNKIAAHLAEVGFEAPYVFNKTDLQQSDHWLELYAREGDSWVLIPITGTNGTRMSYSGFDWLFFSNHNSDLLYFPHSNFFRRYFTHYKDNFPAHFAKNAAGDRVVTYRSRYDYYRRRRSGQATYRAIMRRTRTSQVKLWESDPSLFDAETVFQQDYVFDPQNGLVAIPGTTIP